MGNFVVMSKGNNNYRLATYQRQDLNDAPAVQVRQRDAHRMIRLQQIATSKQDAIHVHTPEHSQITA